MIINQQRSNLRKQVRTLRNQLSKAEQQFAADKLVKMLVKHTKIQSGDKVAVYLANDGELDPMPFIEHCWQQNKQVYLPVIHPFSRDHLLFLRYRPTSPMMANKFGILEPILSVSDVCPVEQLDVLITPLVAFDQSGGRLGMGGGFYDRTLSRWYQHFLAQKSTMHPIAIAHDCQQVEKVPMASWDVPIPEIITPSRHIIADI